jgi:IS5 family transposase
VLSRFTGKDRTGAFCQRHGIRLSGSRLGRPKNDPELVAAEKQQFIDDQRQRNAVKGKIGEAKHRYGLGLIREMLAVNQGSTIAMNMLVLNLQKLLEASFFRINRANQADLP